MGFSGFVYRQHQNAKRNVACAAIMNICDGFNGYFSAMIQMCSFCTKCNLVDFHYKQI